MATSKGHGGVFSNVSSLDGAISLDDVLRIMLLLLRVGLMLMRVSFARGRFWRIFDVDEDEEFVTDKSLCACA